MLPGHEIKLCRWENVMHPQVSSPMIMNTIKHHIDSLWPFQKLKKNLLIFLNLCSSIKSFEIHRWIWFLTYKKVFFPLSFLHLSIVLWWQSFWFDVTHACAILKLFWLLHTLCSFTFILSQHFNPNQFVNNYTLISDTPRNVDAQNK